MSSAEVKAVEVAFEVALEDELDCWCAVVAAVNALVDFVYCRVDQHDCKPEVFLAL